MDGKGNVEGNPVTGRHKDSAQENVCCRRGGGQEGGGVPNFDGPFSAVSTPIAATTASFESSRRVSDLIIMKQVENVWQHFAEILRIFPVSSFAEVGNPSGGTTGKSFSKSRRETSAKVACWTRDQKT